MPASRRKPTIRNAETENTATGPKAADIDTIYIGGEWVTPLSTSGIEIRSSATGAPVGSVADGMVPHEIPLTR